MLVLTFIVSFIGLSCLEPSMDATVKARRWGAIAPRGAEGCHATALGHWQTRQFEEPSRCGRIGVSLSILCSGLLPSGGAAQTNGSLRARALFAFANLRIPPARPVRSCRCPPACSLLAARRAARSSLWWDGYGLDFFPSRHARVSRLFCGFALHDVEVCGSGSTLDLLRLLSMFGKQRWGCHALIRDIMVA
jgi:hypothetical protein